VLIVLGLCTLKLYMNSHTWPPHTVPPHHTQFQHQVGADERAFAPTALAEPSGAEAHPDTYAASTMYGGSLTNTGPVPGGSSRMLAGSLRTPLGATDPVPNVRRLGTPSAMMEFNALFPKLFPLGRTVLERGPVRAGEQGPWLMPELGPDDQMLYAATMTKEVAHGAPRPKPAVKRRINALHGSDSVVLYHNPAYAVGLGRRQQESPAASRRKERLGGTTVFEKR
jgi:hypothetical protein